LDDNNSRRKNGIINFSALSTSNPFIIVIVISPHVEIICCRHDDEDEDDDDEDEDDDDDDDDDDDNDDDDDDDDDNDDDNDMGSDCDS
jgi:hypothetical protein